MESTLSKYKLPNIVQLKILLKLKPKELVRMRRTCSTINSLVENQKEQFASRPSLGINLVIYLMGEAGTIMFFYAETAVVSCISAANNCKEYVDWRLSGISLNTIDVKIVKPTDEIYNKLEDVFSLLKPFCQELNAPETLKEHIIPLTNHIQVANPAGMCFTDNNLDLDTQLFFKTLKEVNNCSKYHLKCDKAIINYDGILDEVSPFLRVEIKTTFERFYSLLWDIYQTKDMITLKSLKVAVIMRRCVPDYHQFPYTYSSVPPFEVLPKVSGYFLKTFVMTLDQQFVVIADLFQGCRGDAGFDIHFSTVKSRAALFDTLCRVYNSENPPNNQLEEDLLAMASSII